MKKSKSVSLKKVAFEITKGKKKSTKLIKTDDYFSIPEAPSRLE